MEIMHLENINLAEVLPRINDINVLPFGVVKMDLTGKILEYNMAEAELTGTDPAWALGKNFFNEVATCTNTPAFYGKFLKVCFEESKIVVPSILASFEKNGSDRHTLTWNPKDALEHPLITHFYNSALPKNLRTGVKFLVHLGIKPPKNSPVAFPFVKSVESGIENEIVSQDLDNIPPPEFLKDVSLNPLFSTHIVIGLPDNEIFEA